MSSGPLVVAHRGASVEFPEHTLAAYEAAIAYGADALECDVRLTADDQLVCVHDATLERTSNGRGPVSTRTLAELREFDFRAQWNGDPAVHHPILTLEDLLALATGAGRPVGLSIETKHPTSKSLVLEQRVAEALRRHGLVPKGTRPSDPHEPGAVRVMSFSAAALGRMRDLAPSIPTVYLIAQPRDEHLAGALPYGAVVLGPWLEWVRSAPEAMARATGSGLPIHVWTVDAPDDIRMCRDLGAAAVISNRPDVALTTLGR